MEYYNFEFYYWGIDYTYDQDLFKKYKLYSLLHLLPLLTLLIAGLIFDRHHDLSFPFFKNELPDFLRFTIA